MIFSGRGNGLPRLLAAVLCLFAAAASLQGKGREEGVLSQADRLIAEREHDQAIRLLSAYMRDNPDRFREGQSRLRRIVQLRALYNQIVTILLDTVETYPENDERILELSTMLLTIESPANPNVRHFLAQIHYLAEFNTNRKRLERIFQDAREQLQRNDFSGALATYASGLDIFQDAFFAAGYGQEAEDTASLGLQSIERNIQDFAALAAPFGQASRQLAALDAPSLPFPQALREAYSRLSPMMEELAALQEDFLRIRESYDAQLAILQREHQAQGDRSFLAFAGWLISGPAGQKEGMTGTLERFWHLLIDPAQAALENIASRSYEAGHRAMADMDFSGGLYILEDTAHYLALAMEMTKNANSFAALGGSPRYLVHGETLSAEKAGVYLRLHSMAVSLLFLKQAGAIGLQGAALESRGFPAMLSWQSGDIGLAEAISMEQDARSSFRAMLDELRALYDGIDAEIKTARSYEELLAAGPGSYAYLANARVIIANLSGRLGTQEYHSAVRQFTIANANMARQVIELERAFDEGNALILGIDRELEGFGIHTARYPLEGMQVLNRIRQNIEENSAAAGDLLALYAEIDRAMLAAPEMGALHAAARNLHARLLSLQNRNAAAIAAAGLQAERANALRVDADRLFQAAQAALVRSDFDSARGSLLRAIDQYDASLAVQESASLRNFRDSDVVHFGAEIARLENQIVVRDVRGLVTSARDSYFAGNMEQAESLLVQAQNRWRLTNIAAQPEVEHWLRLVRGALSLDLARSIPPTAPLFAEMSQLLSNANRSYNEGVSLLNAGRRTEGIVRFSDALEKTREVRLMFPMNHSARMLELRIEQQTDMAAFNARFQQRLNQAVAGARARNLESFADLQDLAAINPQFPGIQAILTQAEIDMGFRPPPTDPADIARSSELTRTAESHVSSRDSIRLELAGAQLEEAIRLNPNNTQAQSLMDQLHILMTGTGTFVLSSHAQAQYNAALREFLRGNYLSANAIVQQLLRDPESQRSPLIQDLRRRIDALL